MTSNEIQTFAGTVMFFWDSGDDERHLLVNIEPDDLDSPSAFELLDDLRDAAIEVIEDGVRVEVDYELEHHELVDPEGATTHDSDRVRIVAIRFE